MDTATTDANGGLALRHKNHLNFDMKSMPMALNGILHAEFRTYLWITKIYVFN